MRPSPPEAIHGLTKSMLTGILPELESAWAQAQLRTGLALLGTIAAEWDGAADNLVRENAMLQRLCALAGKLAGDRATPFSSYRHALNTAAELPPAADLRMTTLAERNGHLWQALQPVIEAAGGATGAEPWLAPLRAELQPLLRAYVAARHGRPPS